jgi:hypothetical protein
MMGRHGVVHVGSTTASNLRHSLHLIPCDGPCQWARREVANLRTQVSAPSATSRRICQ